MSGAEKRFSRAVASLEDVFEFLQQFADEHRLDDRTILAINLVVEELFTNMVRHNVGGGDHITLALDHDDSNIFLELEDVDVEPFDPTTVTPVRVHAGIEAREPGGLGVHLVRKLVDDVSYDYDTEDRRMRISVKKRLEL